MVYHRVADRASLRNLPIYARWPWGAGSGRGGLVGAGREQGADRGGQIDGPGWPGHLALPGVAVNTVEDEACHREGLTALLAGDAHLGAGPDGGDELLQLAG